MIVLGLTAYNRASSCSLFQNGELLSCIFEENLSHVFNDRRFPGRAIRETFLHFDLVIDDIDLICFSDNPLEKIKVSLEEQQSIAQMKRNFLKLEEILKNDLGYQKDIYFSDEKRSLLGTGIFESEMYEGSYLVVSKNLSWGSFSPNRLIERGQDDLNPGTTPNELIKKIEDSFNRDEGEILVIDEAGILKNIKHEEMPFRYIQGSRALSIGTCVCGLIERSHLIPRKTKYSNTRVDSDLKNMGDFRKYFHPLNISIVLETLKSGKEMAYFSGSTYQGFSSTSILLSSTRGDQVRKQFEDAFLDEILSTLPSLKAGNFNLPEKMRVSSPLEALDAFLRTDVESLVINNHLIRKSEISIELLNLYQRTLRTKKKAHENHS